MMRSYGARRSTRRAFVLASHCGAAMLIGGSEVQAQDDCIQVPKSTAATLGALVAASMAWKLWPTEAAKASAQKDHTKMENIAETLKGVLMNTQDIIKETEEEQDGTSYEPLPLMRLLTSAKVLLDSVVEKVTANPTCLSEEVAQMGTPSPTKKEVDDLALFLPMAMSAYSSREDLENQISAAGLHLLYHDATTEMGRTSHYVALDKVNKRVIISIKGTSDINDVLTDVVCRPTPLFKDEVKALKTINQVAQGHEAIASAAHALKDRLGFLLTEFTEPRGYEVVVTGHSLGAGTATLLAILLREESGLQNVRAVAFATPPVADKETALASKSYVTSMVHHNDCIPRASVANLVTLNHVLTEIDTIVQKEGDKAAHKEVHAIMKKEISIHKSNMRELYVPGKVIYVYHDGTEREKYHGAVSDGTFPLIKTIVIASNMITDHLGDGYTSAVAGLSKSLT